MGDSSETPQLGAKRSFQSVEGPSRPSDYPKKRVNVACEVCRVRKTKCDAARPSCLFCSQSGAVCVYRLPALVDSSTRTSNEREGVNDDISNSEVLAGITRIESLLHSLTNTVSIPARPIDHSRYSTTFSTSPLTVNQTPLTALQGDDTVEQTLFVGLSLKGLSSFTGHHVPDTLIPLTIEDGDGYLNVEDRRGSEMFSSALPSIHGLDLSSKTCWRLQQSFTHSVLPWCPFLDPEECAHVVTRVSLREFPEDDLETCLTLFILALGAVAKDRTSDDKGGDFLGNHYFQVAADLSCRPRHSSYSITAVQCKILMAFYYLFCLRPVQAFDTIHQASLAVLRLLQSKSRMETDHIFCQQVYRAYWACYLTEHELQSTVSYSSRLLQMQHESIPLPSFDHDEPGVYWFLAEIAFRKIFSSSRDGSGWNTIRVHKTAVVQEITLQVLEWYNYLPTQIKFPTNMTPLIDPHKSFLRAQYFAILGILHWSSVVQLLMVSPASNESRASSTVVDSASKCLEYFVTHVHAVEGLFQERHLLLMANISGLNCIAILLACTYNVPELAGIQQPTQYEAIIKARDLLQRWSANPVVADGIARIEDILSGKQAALSPT